MGLMTKSIIVVCLIVGLFSTTEAASQGPTELISGTWGPNSDQFGIEYGDTNDVYPHRIFLLSNGSTIVEDIINGRTKIYDNAGTLTKVFKCIKTESGEWNEECRIEGNYIQTTSDGNIWVDLSEYQQPKYSLYSPTGQLIKTSITRPLELGKVTEQPLSGGRYKISIAYPDINYSLLGGPFEKYQRDATGRLNAITGKLVKKFNQCGKALGS